MNTRNRKLFIGIVVGIGLLAVPLLYHRLGTGRLIVELNNSYSEVSVLRKSDGEVIETGRSVPSKRVDVALQRGEYAVSIKSNSSAITKTVYIRSLDTTYVKTAPEATLPVEPVSFHGARDINATSKEVSYLDLTNYSLSEIGTDNKISSVVAKKPFRSVSWVSEGQGVAQDSDGSLYKIENGSASRIKTPSTSNRLTYSYSRSGLFVGLGNRIFFSSDLKNYTEIYKTKSVVYSLSAVNNKVALSYIRGEGLEGSRVDRVVVIDSKGNDQGSVGVVPLESFWSKTGKYLAIRDEDSVTIYDSSFKKIETLPASSIDNISWLSDQVLFYSIEDELWSHDIHEGSTKLIANMPLAEKINSMSVSNDGDYVYLSTTGTRSQTLRKVGLKKQSPNQALYNLQTVLPYQYDYYSVNLINFTKPVITIEIYSQQPGADYVGQARQKLQASGIDSNNFPYQTRAMEAR